MGHSLVRLPLFFLIGLGFLGQSLAANPRPAQRSFKLKSPLTFEVTAGVAFSIDLEKNAVAEHEPYFPIEYWKSSNLPANVAINGGFLTGNISATGSFNFNLSAKDKNPSGEGNILNHPATLVVSPPPPAFKDDRINLGVQREGDNFEKNLKDFLVDASLATGFDAAGLPRWMKLDKSTGRLWGTPERKDVGPYDNIQFTVIGLKGTDTAVGYGLVQEVIKPPKWVTPTIPLKDVDEEAPMSQDTKQYVLAPDPDTKDLTFSFGNNPPAWLNIGKTTGTLYGTPPDPAHVEVLLTLSATIHGITYTDTANFSFNVLKVNHRPKWLGKPLVLEPAWTGVPYLQKLLASATDEDGDELTFELSPGGPDWAKLGAKDGEFKGTPGKSNLQPVPNKWTAKVTDPSGLFDTTEIWVEIKKSNEPPVWKEDPTVLKNAKDGDDYQVDLSEFAKDPDGDKMTFTIVDFPPNGQWATISNGKMLQGTPHMNNVGLNKFRIKVSDGKSSPDDIADVLVMVDKTNHKPYWTVKPILKQVNEEEPMSFDISFYAKDDDVGDTLTISKGDGPWPSWLEITPQGILTGTPPQEGKVTFNVRATDRDGLFADNKVELEVLHKNHPPRWTSNPVVLKNAKEDTPYQPADLNGHVVDPDLPNDKLRFVKISSTPDWVKISADGILTGTPGHNDAGKTQSFEVRVIDEGNADAVATIEITVEFINHPPEWIANPILMSDAYEGKSYQFILHQYAKDIDANEVLSFEKTSPGNDWLQVSKDGIITGTPTRPDVGTWNIEFKVTDKGGLSALTTAKITVIKTEQPPFIDPKMPKFVVKERKTLEEELTKWVTDPEQGTLHFTSLPSADCDSWVKISDGGKMTLTPRRPQVGYHECPFKVNNAKLYTLGTLKIEVLKDPRKPYWLSEPIMEAPLKAKTNIAFTNNIAHRAKDLDNLPLSFSRKAKGGPAWLAVAQDGGLSGTPGDSDVGQNSFTLAVCNSDNMCADENGTLLVDVEPGIQKDIIQIDTPVPNARAELLWVIDNSKFCNNTLKELKKYIGSFYDELKTANIALQIRHANLLISSDVDEFNAKPMTPTNDKALFTSEHPQLAATWKDRVNLAFSPSLCENCWNSPIWAMFRLFESLPNNTELYHNGYVMPGVPVDSFIVTHQQDHYRKYTKNIPAMVNYTASDFLRDFLAFHKREEKAFRVSAIAPECPKLEETTGEMSSVASETNPYRDLVNGTKGLYFGNNCSFNAQDALHKHAAQIIFRSYVHAKQRIPLSKTPLDPQSVKVTLAGVALTPDVWRYDSGSNEVVISWYLIDKGQLRPGDKLEISYRIS